MYYKRRQAAAVVALVVLALVIVLVLSRCSGGSSTPTAETSAAQSPTAAATSSNPSSEQASAKPAASDASEAASESAEGRPRDSKEPSARPGSTPVAADAKQSCELADLRISARTNQPNYREGEQPVFYMTVSNPTKADCVIDLDQEPLRFEVYDLNTNQRVWSDIDCNPAVSKGSQTFASGKERYFEAAWSRTASAPGACQNREPVPAAGYYLHTVLGTNPSQAVTFNLR